MKTKILTTLTVLLVLISFASVSGQSSSPFNGEWKINKEKSVQVDNNLFLSKIKIELKTDSIFTVRIYENGNGEQYPFEENLSLDGKDCKIVIYEMPRTSKATLSASDGSIVIESTITFYRDSGEDYFQTREIWKVDNTSKILTAEFTNNSSAGTFSGTHYFNKLE